MAILLQKNHKKAKMDRKVLLIVIITTLICFYNDSYSQENKKWTLRECIDYALSNNVSIKSAEISVKSSLEDLQQAKASMLPSLSLSSSQNFSAQKQERTDESFVTKGSYTGSYALNTSVTLYSGGKISLNRQQQEIALKMNELTLNTQRNNIEISVTQAYLNVLYANESLKTIQKSVELSEIQVERTKALLEVGSKSSVDVAQIEAQLSSDKYQLTLAENTLAQAILTLKQLLEIDSSQDFQPFFPDPDTLEVPNKLPELSNVYEATLEYWPEIKNSQFQIESAKIEEKIAYSGFLPSINASASIGTGNISGSNYSFYNQLENKLNENVGLTVSIPIFNKRATKTAVNKAQYQIRQAELNSISVRKSLLSAIESLYQDASSAQSRYKASTENLKYTELSYTQVLEQYNQGMKNIVELLSGRQAYLSAIQEKSQAKYQALLSLKLLQFYMNQPINL
jgi:outer membrane protein